MEPRKIIQIRNAAPTDFGGGERFPIFLAQELNANNIDNLVLSGSAKLLDFAAKNNINHQKTWWWQKQNWSGVRVLLFPLYFLWQIALTLYYVVLFTKLRPTTIHIQSKDDFIAATFAGKLLKKRVVWTDHADLKHIFKNITIPFKNPIGKLVYLAALNADHIMVVSNSELKEMKKSLPSASKVLDKIKIVHNGVFDAQKSGTNKPTGKKGSAPFTYILASRLVTDKGIRESIDAFTQLQSKCPDTRLLVMGSGPEEEKFKQRAKDNPNITFIGHKNNPLVHMSGADVFLLPTYHEGFSVALVEAAMLGLPVITTDVGGNPEIIKDGKNGLLIPAKDTMALQRAMEDLYLDEEKARSFGQANRQVYLDSFSFKDIVKKQILPLYNIDTDYEEVKVNDQNV